MIKIFLLCIGCSVIFGCLFGKGVEGSNEIVPCEDYTCDSLALRMILDSIGYESFPVDVLADSIRDGRIVMLSLPFKKITSLPNPQPRSTALLILF